MDASKLKVGSLYQIVGGHVLKLTELPKPHNKTTATFAGHGNLVSWIDVKDIIQEADPVLFARYEEQARIRGIACKDTSCWCRSVTRP